MRGLYDLAIWIVRCWYLDIGCSLWLGSIKERTHKFQRYFMETRKDKPVAHESWTIFLIFVINFRICLILFHFNVFSESSGKQCQWENKSLSFYCNPASKRRCRSSVTIFLVIYFTLYFDRFKRDGKKLPYQWKVSSTWIIWWTPLLFLHNWKF